MQTLSRRSFLLRTGLVAASGLHLSATPSFLRFLEPRPADEDEELFTRKIEWAQARNLSDQPLGKIIAEVGRSFLETPYVAHSLEAPGEEHLVINLRAFDCVTFVESTLALSRCIRMKQKGFGDFARQLQTMRYRNGVISGYSSRLHYFTDWIADNERKGLVHNVTGTLGGKPVHKVFRIMTSHRSSYRQLGQESEFSAMRAIERRLSAKPYRVLPRGRVASSLEKIQDGDIIALATSIDGIDVTHTGLAVVTDGTVRYLHAPLSGGAVTLSKGSLADYVDQGSSTLTGIIVARPLEPARDKPETGQ